MIKKYIKQLDYNTILLFSLIVFNFIFKGYYISYTSIAGDEPFSIFYAKLDLQTIINDLSSGNNPPLYEVLLHFWIKVFGTSSAAVRLLSLIFSSITVFYIYKLGKSFFNIRVAVYTALLFIFSNYQIYFAHEARVYALVGLLSVMSMYYYLKIIIHGDLQRLTIIKLILINVVLIYSHYFGFFVLLIQFIFLIANKELRTRYWKTVLLVTGAIFILYIPNSIVFINRFLDSSTNGTWLEPVVDLGNLHDIIHLFSNNSSLVYLLILFVIWFAAGTYVFKSGLNKILKYLIILFLFPLFFLTGSSIFVETPHLLLLTREENYVFFFLFIAFSFVLLVVFNHKSRIINIQTKLIVFWFWFPFLGMFIISLDSLPYTISMFNSRYLMMISIGFYLFIAISLDTILKPSKKANFMLPIVLIYLFIFTSQPNIPNQRNVFQVVEKINEIRKENTLIIFCPRYFDLNLMYYFDNPFFVQAKSIEEVHLEFSRNNVYGLNSIKGIDLTNCDHIIFLDVSADFSYPKNNILNVLNDRYIQKSKHHVYEIFNIYEFEGEKKSD